MSKLSFLGNIGIAVRIVQSSYPSYGLWEVIASTPNDKPTNDTEDITKITVRFRNAAAEAVAIDSNDDPAKWGEWGQPYEESGGEGYDNVSWPFDMDITDAQALIVKAGYKDPFSTVDINHPGRKGPCYVFGTTSGDVCVSITNGNVWTKNSKATNRAKKSNLPLSFLGNVNIAIRIVQAQYHDYVLYQIFASTKDGKATEDTEEITQINVQLRDAGGRVMGIDSGEEWGTWGTPYPANGGFGFDNVPWPIKLGLEEARDLLVEAGYEDPFSNVNINHPGNYEPRYVFGTKKGNICVNITDHKVWREDSKVMNRVNTANIPLSFLGNVNVAIRIVQGQYPTFNLYQVIAGTEDGKSTEDTKDINKITVTLRNGTGKVIGIDSGEEWGTWGTPYPTPGGFGYNDVSWPFDLGIKDAQDLLIAAGYDDPFSTVDINHPGNYEPRYVFGTKGGNICVNITDHKVWPEKQAEGMMPWSTTRSESRRFPSLRGLLGSLLCFM